LVSSLFFGYTPFMDVASLLKGYNSKKLTVAALVTSSEVGTCAAVTGAVGSCAVTGRLLHVTGG
jgi:hypothetical protein